VAQKYTIHLIFDWQVLSYLDNNNTNICNARSVSKHTESEAQAVAR